MGHFRPRSSITHSRGVNLCIILQLYYSEAWYLISRRKFEVLQFEPIELECFQNIRSEIMRQSNLRFDIFLLSAKISVCARNYTQLKYGGVKRWEGRCRKVSWAQSGWPQLATFLHHTECFLPFSSSFISILALFLLFSFPVSTRPFTIVFHKKNQWRRDAWC